jgi:hypothetical protein
MNETADLKDRSTKTPKVLDESSPLMYSEDRYPSLNNLVASSTHSVNL